MNEVQEYRAKLQEIRDEIVRLGNQKSDLEDDISNIEFKLDAIEARIDRLYQKESSLTDTLNELDPDFEAEENDEAMQRANIEKRYGGALPDNIHDYWIGMKAG